MQAHCVGDSSREKNFDAQYSYGDLSICTKCNYCTIVLNPPWSECQRYVFNRNLKNEKTIIYTNKLMANITRNT